MMADGSVIISTELDNSGIEDGLKETQKEVKKAGKTVETLGDSFEKAGKDGEKNTKKVRDGLEGLKNTIADVASTVGAGLGLGAMVSAGNSLIETTEELRMNMSMLEQNAQNAGVGLASTQDAMMQLNTVSGETDSSLEAVSNLLAAGVPENKLQMAVEGLANAAITFPDTIKIESLADSLQETLATGEATGQFAEVLDRLGIGAQNFSAQLALCTNENQRLDMALSVLNAGGLAGTYEGWAKANPELVASRDATFELETAMAELAEALLPMKTTLTEIASGAVSIINEFGGIDQVFEAIISGVAAIAAVNAVNTISGLVEAFMNLGNATAIANAQSVVATAGIGALFYAIIQLAQAWDSMSGAERVVAVLGAITAAAFAAAVAVGAFQSAVTLGIAAAAIALGIGAILFAVNNAKQRAETELQQFSAPNVGQMSGGYSRSASIPKLAKGAVIPPNREFLAVLGDQKSGTNVESPLATIKQAVAEVMAERGGAGNAPIELYIDGQKFARITGGYNSSETRRKGVNIVAGGVT